MARRTMRFSIGARTRGRKPSFPLPLGMGTPFSPSKLNLPSLSLLETLSRLETQLSSNFLMLRLVSVLGEANPLVRTAAQARCNTCRDRSLKQSSPAIPLHLWCGGLSVSLSPGQSLGSIPKAPKAQCASLGCDLIRISNCHAVHAPRTTDAQTEPSRQKRVDHCCESDRSHRTCQRIGTFLHVRAI